jgi:lysozyme
MIASLKDQLIRDEGSKRSAYQDSRGFWTIGIGTCIDERANCGLTSDEILLLFNNRVAIAKDTLVANFPWIAALDPVRIGALENMTFQMGAGGVAEFRYMLAALQKGDYPSAAGAMLDSSWAKVQSPARATRLSLQIQSGIWQ